MNLWDQQLALGVAAFITGSIPFAYLIGRLAGVDIRKQGSGNPGASNVFRVVGPVAGIGVFLLDMAKSAAPLLLSRVIFDLTPEWRAYYEIILGLVAIVGHVYSPFLKGRGGKGVASLIGVVAVLFPLGLLAGAISGLSVILIFRYFSLGSLVGVAVMPVTYFVIKDQPWHGKNLPLMYLLIIATVLTFVRHTDNIKRLWRGEEHKLRGVHKSQ
ncbi:MAG: glycerol-3-phosphate 1-O-acyltransferase PlsY [Leptospiraceae bacterium]|nr:glycerol-3-phosphate 1-O-acyltransferase PlsY [Leptospiraceae bacterium]